MPANGRRRYLHHTCRECTPASRYGSGSSRPWTISHPHDGAAPRETPPRAPAHPPRTTTQSRGTAAATATAAANPRARAPAGTPTGDRWSGAETAATALPTTGREEAAAGAEAIPRQARRRTRPHPGRPRHSSRAFPRGAGTPSESTQRATSGGHRPHHPIRPPMPLPRHRPAMAADGTGRNQRPMSAATRVAAATTTTARATHPSPRTAQTTDTDLARDRHRRAQARRRRLDARRLTRDPGGGDRGAGRVGC